jgi:hypothetical protein
MATPANRPQLLDRYTTMGDLTANASRMLRRYMPIIVVGLGLETALLIYQGSPAAMAFALIAIGTAVAFGVWAHHGRGVPILPMMVMQALLIYGLPIVSGHETVLAYSMDQLNQAGLEVLLFCVALVLSWRVAMQVLTPARARAYTLLGIDDGGLKGLSQLGFGLAGIATVYLVLESLGSIWFLFEILPSGSRPIVLAAVSASSFCGFFLLAMISGSGGMQLVPRVVFWSLLILNCMISASSFLLSASFGVLASVMIGLFWSSGRIPWTFVLLTSLLLSFYNSGKYDMRGKYWESAEEDIARPTGLAALPSTYAEWTIQSWQVVIGGEADDAQRTFGAAPKKKDQGLLQRLNNLQNILYVIDAMEVGHVQALGGKTYTLIPPLLIPRIFWPAKPRTHEGQVMLNVHFGRQDLASTFKTYVAWGLLPEAYGNFGPIKGSLIIGIVLGLLFAWAECYTTHKPLLSAEGFVAFVIFLILANSFEMVSSVMVTAMFQAVVPVIVACAPFVRLRTVVRPTDSGSGA